MSEDRSDRRIRKTRAVLRRCLSTLLLKKPVRDISVRGLAEFTGINRGTSYLHCHDVFDLLENLEEEMFLQFAVLLERRDIRETKGSPRELPIDLFYFVQKNADLFRILLGISGDPHFLNQPRAVFQGKILAPWQAAVDDNSSYEYEYLHSYVIDGTIGMVRRWAENDTDLSPEDMSALAECFIVFGSPTLLPPNWTLTRS